VIFGLAWYFLQPGDPAASGPDERFLRSRLATDLPAYVKLNSVQIEVSENVGDRIEPVFKTRFRGTLVLTADTFMQSSVDDGVVILVRKVEKGAARELYGLALSKLSAGSWKTQFSFDNNPIANLGRPRDFFPGRVIVRGSSDEVAFREEQRRHRDEEQRNVEAQQRDEALAQQVRLDEARREAERNRTEAEIQSERRRAESAREAELRAVDAEIQAQRRREEAERTAKEAAEAAERRRQAEEARKRETEVWMRAWANTTSPFNGTLAIRFMSTREPVRLRFTSFDIATGSLRSEIELPTRNGVCRLEGQWVGDQIQANGTAQVRTLGGGWTNYGPCSWQGTAEGPNTLVGKLMWGGGEYQVSFSK
jgi:hypothetical protein